MIQPPGIIIAGGLAARMGATRGFPEQRAGRGQEIPPEECGRVTEFRTKFGPENARFPAREERA